MTIEYLGPLDPNYEEYPQEEYIPPEPPIRNVTNMEQYRGNPNTIFIDEPSRKIREYGSGGEILSEDQMPLRSEQRIPPKPKADDLDLFTNRSDFRKLWLPEAEKEGDNRGQQAAEQFITTEWGKITSLPNSSRALSYGDEKIRLKNQAQLIKEKTKRDYVDTVAKSMDTFFNEKYKSELETAKQLKLEEVKEKNRPPTEWDVRERAAKGDPGAIKMLSDLAKANQPQATEWGLRERAAKGDLNAISALKQHEGEKKAEDILKREISDKDLYKPLINNLPKTKDEAVQANIRVEKYKTLYSMAEQGAGGLIPGLKGMLAPIAEAMGLDANTVTKMSEAQVYQLMARAAVGSQRLMLVGSGQVSNYEQALMQRLSGGSIKTSREAAKELFKFYIKESEGLVDAYNTQIDNISEKFPDVKKMYGYVGKGSTTQGGGKPRLTPEQAREALKQRGK